MLPPTAEHQMGMRVHEPRRGQPASRVQHLYAFAPEGQFPVRVYALDHAAIYEHRGVLELSVFPLFLPPRRRIARGRLQQADVMNQQHNKLLKYVGGAAPKPYPRDSSLGNPH